MAKINITKPTEAELADLGVRSWEIWSCGVSAFPWHYDCEETCYILEGDVSIETPEETVRIGPGDFVRFPQGLSCSWRVHKPVRKHYRFD